VAHGCSRTAHRQEYGDGSKVTYLYENASSRVRQVIDEKQQIALFTHNRDDTLNSIAYANTVVPTPGVTYTYDPNYVRPTSMTDGTGTTRYSYHPVAASPTLGANQLASVDGPLPNDTITYTYDELGRRVSTAINGVASTMIYDAAGRVISETNALGTFTYAYHGSSGRMLTNTLPNGQIEERSYGDNLGDRTLQRITHRSAPPGYPNSSMATMFRRTASRPRRNRLEPPCHPFPHSVTTPPINCFQPPSRTRERG
jgi:YD repeat-containing protein